MAISGAWISESRVLSEAAHRSDTADHPAPAQAGQQVRFLVQIEGRWHEGILAAPDWAVIEGPMPDESYGEARECRLSFPFGRLDISVVIRAEVLRDQEIAGAVRLRFFETQSPVRAELDALLRLIATRQRRAARRANGALPPSGALAEAALLGLLPAPPTEEPRRRFLLPGWLSRWMSKGPSTSARSDSTSGH